MPQKNAMVKRQVVMAKESSTASHTQRIRGPFTGKGLLLIVLFLWNLASLAFPLCVLAKDVPLPGEQQTVGEVERLNKEALQLFSASKQQEAIALWKKADGLASKAKFGDSLHLDVLVNLGQAYLKMGNGYYSLAESYLNRVIDIDPDRWDTYMILGDLCYDDGEPDCAIGNYDLALRLNPGYKHANTARNRMEGLAQDTKNPVAELKPTSTQRKYVYTYFMDEEKQYYFFYITFNRESNLARIDILREGDKKIHQTFTYGDFECGPALGGENLLAPADFNAHGKMNLKLQCNRIDGSRAGYLYFVYSRSKGMFVPFGGGMLPDAISGPDTQEVRVFNNNGDAGMLFEESFYRIAAGKLVLVKEVKQHETAQKEGKRYYKRTIRERSVDTMAVVSESLIEAGVR